MKTVYSIFIGTVKIPFAIALGIILLVVFDGLICWGLNLGFKNGDDLYLDKIKTGNVWDWFKKLGKLK